MRGYLPVLACVLIFSSVAVRAEEGDARPVGVKAAARGTVGTGGYLGRGASLQYGDAWRLKGSYSDYRFDGSTGTTRTAGLRASYQGENLSAGLSFSLTPRNDFYANRSFGADGGWVFILDDSDEPSGLEELELGAFWSQTRHSQIVPATPALPDERNVVINQHDFGVNAAVTAWDLTLSVDASRSVYDQEFDFLPAISRRRPRLAQTASLVNGFPERTGSARLDWSRWRAFSPYVSFAATRYSIQPQPASATASAGAAMKFGDLGLDLGYDLVRQKGTPDTKYFNFGASFKF
jgi:hypothetical protein